MKESSTKLFKVILNPQLKEASILEKNFRIQPTQAFLACNASILKNLTFNFMLNNLNTPRIQSKRVDVFLRGGPDYLHEDWLKKSVPISMSGILVGHQIHDQKRISYFNLLENFKIGIGLTSLYLCSFLGILAFSFLFNALTRRIRTERGATIEIHKRIALALNKLRIPTLTAIGLFALFAGQFIWFSELFLTNNIKVEV